jgi:hypothetical protein
MAKLDGEFEKYGTGQYSTETEQCSSDVSQEQLPRVVGNITTR